VTIKDAFPIPRIDDSLDTLAGSTWFSTLDMSAGYWQVELDADAAEKSSFAVRSGLYKWKVMPFGLCNAPATFERLMNRVLAGLHWEIALIYLDDVLVFAKTVEQAIHRLKLVFDRFRQAGFKLKPKKCELFQQTVLYLGHQVSKEGISADPEKVKVIRNWPVPRTVRDVRSFIGLASYYRKFVKGFADIARPMHKLMSKNATFKWTEDCQIAFETLKQRLLTAPILTCPRPAGDFILDTDASRTNIGGVLAQIQDGQEKVIGYASRALRKEEQNYCVTRLELLAVVDMLKHFRHYLYGRPVTVRTDHGSLKWLANFKEPEGQLAHWLERLAEYDLKIVHRPGYQHKNADALSRVPCKQCKRHEGIVEEKPDIEVLIDQSPAAAPEQSDGVATSIRRVKIVPTWTPGSLREAQLEDCTIAPILRAKENTAIRPEWPGISEHSLATKCYWGQWEQLQVKEGVLCKRWEADDGGLIKWLVIVPHKLRDTVLQEMHGGQASGHFGVNKTLGRLRRQYTWYGMSADTRSWIRQCDKCAARKSPSKKLRGELQQPKVGAPMELVALDILGPLPITERGNKYILVIADYHTKWVEAYPMPNQEAETVAQIFAKEFCLRYGFPDQLHSDQGRQFESRLFGEMCKTFYIYKSRTTPYNPKSDGMVERFNRTLLDIVANLISPHCRQRDWDEQLPFATFAYRCTPHASTGETPHMLMLGREVRTPVHWMMGNPADEIEDDLITDYAYELRQRLLLAQERAGEQLKLSARRQKNLYDRKVSGDPIVVGEFVWLQNSACRKGLSPKLQPKWNGPHLVVTKLSDLVYRIQQNGPQGKMKVVHYDKLKPYRGKQLKSWLPRLPFTQPQVEGPVLHKDNAQQRVVEVPSGDRREPRTVEQAEAADVPCRRKKALNGSDIQPQQEEISALSKSTTSDDVLLSDKATKDRIGQPSSNRDSADGKRLAVEQPVKGQLSADKPKWPNTSIASQPTSDKPTSDKLSQPTSDKPTRDKPTRDKSNQPNSDNSSKRTPTKESSPGRYPRRENKRKPARYR
jgi:hypothetical protein